MAGLRNASFAVEENKIVTGNGITIMTVKDREQKIRDIRKAFMFRLHMNRQWAYHLGLCEFFNLINIILQMFLTNWFIGGAFFNLGPRVLAADYKAAMTCLDEFFPKVYQFFHPFFFIISLLASNINCPNLLSKTKFSTKHI